MCAVNFMLLSICQMSCLNQAPQRRDHFCKKEKNIFNIITPKHKMYIYFSNIHNGKLDILYIAGTCVWKNIYTRALKISFLWRNKCMRKMLLKHMYIQINITFSIYTAVFEKNVLLKYKQYNIQLWGGCCWNGRQCYFSYRWVQRTKREFDSPVSEEWRKYLTQCQSRIDKFMLVLCVCVCVYSYFIFWHGFLVSVSKVN